MRRWRTVRLVTRREIRERVCSTGFRVATALLVLGAAAAGALPELLDDDDPPSVDVGVVGTLPPALASTLQFAAGGPEVRVNVVQYPSVTEADRALRDGKADVVVEVGGAVRVLGEESSDRAMDVARNLAGAIPLRAGLESAGVPPDRVNALLAPTPLRIQSVEPPRGDEGAEGAVFLGSLLLYMALVTYGGWVATGVLEEKSSRVVEVVLAAVRPSDLLAGKVLGIGLLGLGQLALLVGAGIAAAVASGVEIPSSVFGAAGLVVLWFVLGFAFYSCLFAVLGAAASRQEDAQSAMGPAIGFLVGAFFLSTFSQSNPESLVARIGSFVPPLAPLTVPARVLLGDAPLWELVVSVVLTAAGAYGLIQLAARAYGGAVLRFGPKLGIRDLWRSATGRPTAARSG